MAVTDIFSVERQLVFYGAYHSNPTNIAIHICCVPMLLWSSMVFLSSLSTPASSPSVAHYFGPYLGFELNWATLLATIYQLYYIILEPVAGLLYVPQMAVMLLSAIPFSHRSDGVKMAAFVQLFSWIAQFMGHGLAEKRAPALLDNILGAFVLAPFFVHMEILFSLGYNKTLHKKMKSGVGVEIAKFRREQAQQKKAE